MAVRVLFYPPYCDLIGQKEIEIELTTDELPFHDFLNLMCQHYPQLQKITVSKDPGNTIPRVLFLINNKAVMKNIAIKDGIEIKVLFPLSGG